MGVLRLNLLGGFDARLDTGTPVSLSSKKAQVLLAYLLLAPGRSHSRKSLTKLLWSTRSDEQARSSLRQALTALRKHLDGHASPLLIERDALGLDAESIEADVVRFERLAAEDDPAALERAWSLYKGEFLEGVSTRDPAGDQWLNQERERLHTTAVATLEKLLRCQMENGASPRLVEIAQALLRLDPLRETAHRALMRAYAEEGQRSAALKQYETCRELLAEELGVEPERQTRILLESIVEDRPHRESEVLPVQKRARPELPLPPKPSVAVLPFTNLSTDPDQEMFADALTEDIITELTRFGELFVISRYSSFAYKGRAAKIEDVGEELGVQYVVEGSVRILDDRVRITAQLIDAITDRHLWAERYDRPLKAIFDIQDELVQTIVGTLWGSIQKADSSRARRRPDLEAYGCLARGRANWLYGHDREGLLFARRLFERAIALDEAFVGAQVAMAYSHLIEYECLWSTSPEDALHRGLEFAERCSALDEWNSATQLCLAWSSVLRRDYDAAGVHFEHALRLNPNDYSNYCAGAWYLVLTGRCEEGIERAWGAFRRNPLAPGACLTAVGLGYYLLAHYDEAVQTLRRISDPEAYELACLAASHAQLGEHVAARSTAEKVEQLAAAEAGDIPIDWNSYCSRPIPLQSPSDLDHVLDGMRKAGLT